MPGFPPFAQLFCQFVPIGRVGFPGELLVVLMLFLLVVTMISVTAATNSAIGLKMASNMQDSYSSFQSAEAGILALFGLVGTADDPFDGDDSLLPFSALDLNSTHPLRNLNQGPGSVDVEVFITAAATQCPRRESGYTADLLACDYYRVASEHDVARKARTKVELGAVKTIIGSAAR